MFKQDFYSQERIPVTHHQLYSTEGIGSSSSNFSTEEKDVAVWTKKYFHSHLSQSCMKQANKLI